MSEQTTAVRTQPLDLNSVPLSGGMRLIEASAGTGKTWAIAGLYTRLVVEAGIPVDSLLVLTYTKAATAELKERIRSRLVACRAALDGGVPSDPSLSAIVEGGGDAPVLKRRLDRAVRGFDEAAIYTIHGFCQRVLADRAFESGVAFDVEVLSDGDELVRAVASDFWRKAIYPASPLWLDYLLRVASIATPDALVRGIDTALRRPGLRIEGGEKAISCEDVERDYNLRFREANTLWTRHATEIEDLLDGFGGFNGNKVKAGSLKTWLRDVDALLGDTGVTLAGPKSHARKLTATALAGSVRKGFDPPEHPFLDALDALVVAADAMIECFGNQLPVLRRRLLDYMIKELEQRKQLRRVQTYDDLLLRLHTALTASGGVRLAGLLRGRYKAALVDEFQDTDPVQYEIIRRIYGGADAPVFLVGDPKQAIYGFRGADVFAYLRARGDAVERYALDRNWRSDEALVNAINTVFENAADPFLLAGIDFEPVLAAHSGVSRLTLNGVPATPLRIDFLRRDDESKPLAKGRAQTTIAASVAGEVATLLEAARSGDARVNGVTLAGGDIAVLVRTHAQAADIAHALRARGVASVQQSVASVYTTEEAEALEHVLAAVAQPASGGAVRTALATSLMGRDAREILALTSDDAAWEATVDKFSRWHDIWRTHGFMQMLRRLMAQEDMAARLLVREDGQRRLTNILHLGELLHNGAGRVAGPEAVVRYLADHRLSRLNGEGGDNEEELMRLDSEDNLVQIVTMHRSKGLQYPVVFCPYLWDVSSSPRNQTSVIRHDPERDNELVLDLEPGRDPQTLRRTRYERLAEDLRLAYVAVTRAQHRCYLVWGAVKGAGDSALAWLLHGADAVAKADDMVADEARLDLMAAHWGGLDDNALCRQLDALADMSNGMIEWRNADPSSGPARISAPMNESICEARVATGPRLRPWRVTSYSALTAGRHGERPDYDGEARGWVERRPAPGSIFAFPGGVRAGHCMHELFERMDFVNDDAAAIEKLLNAVLPRHGFPLIWVPALRDHMLGVLDTPFDEASGLRLRSIGREDRVDELEFHYTTGEFDAAGLARVIEPHAANIAPELREAVERASFGTVSGFMKGYIDLVFRADDRYYLVDYKSNRLGDSAAEFTRERIAEAMVRDAYPLQYLIYTVALHRHLRERLPEYDYDRHFGGAYYLFLRGMTPGGGGSSGVFHDRPPWALVDDVDKFLGAKP